MNTRFLKFLTVIDSSLSRVSSTPYVSLGCGTASCERPAGSEHLAVREISQCPVHIVSPPDCLFRRRPFHSLSSSDCFGPFSPYRPSRRLALSDVNSSTPPVIARSLKWCCGRRVCSTSRLCHSSVGGPVAAIHYALHPVPD